MGNFVKFRPLFDIPKIEPNRDLRVQSFERTKVPAQYEIR
jgi:hypothetical protein